jgi:hypothetical protein
MKLFDAIGYAHAECGRIVGIRNGKKRWVSYDLLEAGEEPPGLSDADFIGGGWLIGWSCAACLGTMIRESGAACTACEKGVDWEDTY